MQRDAASAVMDALQEGYLDALTPTVEAVLEIDSTWAATDQIRRVLVADDSGPAPLRFGCLAEPLLRITAIGRGRTATRALAAGCADFIPQIDVPGIRLKSPSTLAEGRGTSTGNYLVFFTVPAITRPVS